LHHSQTAIHIDRLAGEVAGHAAGHEQRGSGDVVPAADPPRWDHRQRGGALSLGEPTDHGGVDQPRRYAVDGDARPATSCAIAWAIATNPPLEAA
jgi:hypothetical protein